jgi:hypothetical protein
MASRPERAGVDVATCGASTFARDILRVRARLYAP